MRNELPNLRGTFREMGDDRPSGPSFDPAFVIVMVILGLGVSLCIAAILFT